MGGIRMKILFLMLHCPDLNTGSDDMYSDLAVEFKGKGHDVTIMALDDSKPTHLSCEAGINVLRVNTLNSQGNNISLLKKGLAYVLTPYSFRKAYKKYLKAEKFDLILYSAPPITLVDFVNYAKKQNPTAKAYLILRDIHPQSTRDLGLYTKVTLIVYWFFYYKAQKAYRVADYIGCMSQGNIDYIAKIAPKIDKKKIVLLPNWQKIQPYTPADNSVREKYGLQNKFVAIYGGNLAVAQGLENIVILAKHYKGNVNIVFLIVGKGIRKQFLLDEVENNNLTNVKFLDYMPREEYENVMKSADIGIISLNKKYAVPTCPSRVIGYMAMKLPVIAMINANSDYGQFYIENAGCGFWTDDMANNQIFIDFEKLYKDLILRKQMGENGYKYCIKTLSSEKICDDITKQVK
jgi:glycosyltransferase involved in cell wall biosynthesis